MKMGKFLKFLLIGALAMGAPGRADAAVDNVATQWSYLASVLICALPVSTGPPTEPNILLAHLHLAQWHALIALRNTGGSTTEDVVVAYASHKVLSTYFPLQQVARLDPLLQTQLTDRRVFDAQQKLGKQLGQAVALDLVAIARATLPNRSSLYETVTALAKLHVAMHDTFIVLTTLQYGFWNWRPQMAFTAGDPHHEPIPDWAPFIATPAHAEYPSGAVASFAAAAAVLGGLVGERVAFSLPDGGVWGPGCPMQGAVRSVSFSSFQDYVRYMKLSRVYAGAHFNKSVEDAAAVGESVATFVEANWGAAAAAGVLPSATYLSVVAQLPKVQTGFDPIRLVY